MIDKPIDLDMRRSSSEQLKTESRRLKARGGPPAANQGQRQRASIEDQMLAEPERNWIEVMEKWKFLLERYLETPDADDERIQKLIRRALGDMERLQKREERRKR